MSKVDPTNGSFALINAEENANTEKNSNSNTNQNKLDRNITFFGGVNMVFGTIVGSGIFITPTGIIKNVGSVGLSLVLWAVCGAISILGGLCFAELGTAIPKSGAEYNYIMDGFGPFPAFLFMWTSFIIIKPTSVTIVAMTCAQYAVEPFFANCHTPETVIKLVAAFCIILVTLLNIFSTKWSVAINNTLNYFKLACIGLMLGCGVYGMTQGGWAYLDPKVSFTGSQYKIGNIGLAFYSGLWAFDGWNALNYAAEEMKNPVRDLPRAIIWGMVAVTTLYVLINVAYIAVLGPNGIMQSSAVALSVANKYFKNFNWIVPVLVSMSTMGAAITTVFGNGRLLFVAGREGHLPMLLSTIHGKFHTPVVSLVVSSFLSLMYLIPPASTIDSLIEMFSCALWVFFGACFSVQIYIRYFRKDIAKPFQVWIVVPVLMLVVSVVLIVMPFLEDWRTSLISLGIVGSGVPMYCIFILGRKGSSCCGWFGSCCNKIDWCCDKISRGVMGLFGLVYATREEDMG